VAPSPDARPSSCTGMPDWVVFFSSTTPSCRHRPRLFLRVVGACDQFGRPLQKWSIVYEDTPRAKNVKDTFVNKMLAVCC